MSVSVFAAATIANVGPCYDRAGLAISHPGDTVHARLTDSPGVHIVQITGDAGRLPKEAEKNTAGMAAMLTADMLGKKNEGIELRIEKNMPLGSGMGSSAASAAAAAVAVNELYGAPLSRFDLIDIGRLAEKTACGVAHFDNVGPALCGGLLTARGFDIHQHVLEADMAIVIIQPDCEILTADSRAALAEVVDDVHATAIEKTKELDGITRLSQLVPIAADNALLENTRGALIPGFAEMQKVALENGAGCCTISGSGPCLFALCTEEKKEAVALAVKEESAKHAAKPANIFFAEMNNSGAKVLHKK